MYSCPEPPQLGYRPIMKSLVIALLLSMAFILSGCGGSEQGAGQGAKPSSAEWRTAVEDRLGHPFRDDAAWQSYQSVWQDSCEKYEDADAWSLFVAVMVDGGTAASDLQADVGYACPESLDDMEAAIKQVQGSASEVDVACALDPDLRTEDQRQLAEAMGC